jgi:hypothetical protein
MTPARRLGVSILSLIAASIASLSPSSVAAAPSSCIGYNMCVDDPNASIEECQRINCWNAYCTHNGTCGPNSWECTCDGPGA